jgi:hypothetical protein
VDDRARWLTLERLLYGVCLGVAATLRFQDLDGPALGFGEAANAWPAWVSAVTGEARWPAAGEPPTSALLFSLHWLLFWLAGGASDAMVRWPGAAFGTALVLLPWALRPVAGRAAALALAGILAIDSLLVGASRTADGAILSVFCAALVLVCLARLGAGDPPPAGESASGPGRRLTAIAVGLLLVSGPLAWSFLLLLATLAIGWRRYQLAPRPPVALIVTAVVTGVVAATTGFAQWDGPPSVSASLTAWLGDWSGRLELRTAVAGLVQTQPLLVALPLVGLISVWTGGRAPARRRLTLALVVVALAALLAAGQAGVSARLPLTLALALAAALATGSLAVRIAAWLREGAARRAALAWTWIAAVGILALVTVRGAVAVGDQPSPPGPRLLARDVATLCAWRAAPRSCRIDVVAAPWLDPVLAWYLRDLGGVRSVLSPALEASDTDPPLIITPAAWRGGENGTLERAWPLPYVGSQYRADAAAGGHVVLWVPRRP